MANEAVLIHETEIPIPFTVSNTVGIEKGTILMLSDPMTAAASTGSGDIIAGIAAEEKIASDGKTKLGVYRRGIFKVKASGTAIAVGDAVKTANTGAAALNLVSLIGASTSGARVLGHALETAASAETFLIELDIGTAGVA